MNLDTMTDRELEELTDAIIAEQRRRALAYVRNSRLQLTLVSR